MVSDEEKVSSVVVVLFVCLLDVVLADYLGKGKGTSAARRGSVVWIARKEAC